VIIRKLMYAVSTVLFLMLFFGCSSKQETTNKEPESKEFCQTFDTAPQNIEKKLDVNFSGKIKLVGVKADKVSVKQLKVTYYWQLLDDPGHFNRVFVHFTDKENKIVFQNDHSFCNNQSLSELKGKFIQESYLVVIPDSSAGTEVSIKIGIISTGEGSPRLNITSSGGLPTDELDTRAIVQNLKV